MIRKILIILALFIISCKKDSSENQQSPSSTTEQDSLKALDEITSIDEEVSTEEYKQEHDSLEHTQLFNLISKNTNPKRSLINTDSLGAFEIKEVGYFDDTDYAYFFIASPTDSLKEYYSHLSESIGSTMAKGSWFKRQSLSDDFIHTYYSNIQGDSLDLFNKDNRHFGRGYFEGIEFMTINYEDGMSVEGVVALYKFNKIIPADRYYGLTGQYLLNQSVKAQSVDPSTVFTDHILKNLNLSSVDPSNIFQWYVSGYDRLYTNVYYEQENGQIDSYLIETGSTESNIIINLHGDEIREFIATGIVINDKPVLFLLLSYPFSDGGDYCVAFFNGTEYELTC